MQPALTHYTVQVLIAPFKRKLDVMASTMKIFRQFAIHALPLPSLNELAQ